MPPLPSSNPRQFLQGAPVLHVPDVRGTAAFYRDILGFTWDYGDDSYAVVWRDNSAIHFVRGASAPSGVHLFQWVTSTATTGRSWGVGPPWVHRPPTSPTAFGSSISGTSTAWRSSSGRTSNRIEGPGFTTAVAAAYPLLSNSGLIAPLGPSLLSD
jgi:hypothetical protein